MVELEGSGIKMKILLILSAAVSLYFVQTTNAMLRPTRNACSSSAFHRLQGSKPSRVFWSYSENERFNKLYVEALQDNNRVAKAYILNNFSSHVLIHARESYCKAKQIFYFTTKIKNQSLETALGICTIPKDSILPARIDDLRDLSEKSLFPLNTDLILQCIISHLKAGKYSEALISPNILHPIAITHPDWKLEHYALDLETKGKYTLITNPKTGQNEHVCKLKF